MNETALAIVKAEVPVERPIVGVGTGIDEIALSSVCVAVPPVPRVNATPEAEGRKRIAPEANTVLAPALNRMVSADTDMALVPPLNGKLEEPRAPDAANDFAVAANWVPVAVGTMEVTPMAVPEAAVDPVRVRLPPLATGAEIVIAPLLADVLMVTAVAPVATPVVVMASPAAAFVVTLPSNVVVPVPAVWVKLATFTVLPNVTFLAFGMAKAVVVPAIVDENEMSPPALVSDTVPPPDSVTPVINVSAAPAPEFMMVVLFSVEVVVTVKPYPFRSSVPAVCVNVVPTEVVPPSLTAGVRPEVLLMVRALVVVSAPEMVTAAVPLIVRLGMDTPPVVKVVAANGLSWSVPVPVTVPPLSVVLPATLAVNVDSPRVLATVRLPATDIPAAAVCVPEAKVRW